MTHTITLNNGQEVKHKLPLTHEEANDIQIMILENASKRDIEIYLLRRDHIIVN